MRRALPVGYCKLIHEVASCRGLGWSLQSCGREGGREAAFPRCAGGEEVEEALSFNDEASLTAA